MKVRDDQVARPGRVGTSTLSMYDSDAIGRRSEAIARFLGTGRYLAIQTVVVIVWIVLNVVAIQMRWDEYPFILLNLVFSTQAAYAAPLILLAQNRQATRERALAERDRLVNDRILADTEFLSRELAAIRLRLEAVVTLDDIEDLRNEIRQDQAGPDDE